MSLDIVIEAGDWPSEVEAWALLASEALEAEMGETFPEIALLLTNNDHIRKLNAEFRGKDKATNVLSWPTSNYERNLGTMPFAIDADEDFLGDLAFGFETVRDESEGLSLQSHFQHLVIHGILHLRGFDHIADEDAELMEGIEIRALSRLKIGNPYIEEQRL